ncbi:MAG: Ig-like domain-containing protein [Gemmatimonadota bacterium]
MKRTPSRRATLLAALLSCLLLPAVFLAKTTGPKALVVCPPTDMAGCDRIAAQLALATSGGSPVFPGGVDKKHTELRTMPYSQLQSYAAVFVPSLANAPYDLLREDAVKLRLQQVLRGRVAVWSGTPDRGTTSGASAGKLTLIQNLGRWAAGQYAVDGSAGLVVLQDFSDNRPDGTSPRYDWVQGISGVVIQPDLAPKTYAQVERNAANPAATPIVGTLSYDNMASFGLQLPQPATQVGAWGQTVQGKKTTRGQVVLGTAARSASACQVAGPAGGTFSFQTGKVVLGIPSGTLSEEWCISASPTRASQNGYVENTAHVIAPFLGSLSPPVSLTIAYAEANIPGGVSNEYKLVISELRGGSWVEVPGSVVDVAANTVTNPGIDHLGQYAVFISADPGGGGGGGGGKGGSPTATDDAYTTAEDTPLSVAAPGVLANDTDPQGDPLTASLVSGPAQGTLTLNANGSFTYTPAANFSGQATFTYKANDGRRDSNTATVTITVTPVNDAPVAVNDAYSTPEDTPLSVAAPGVLANDTDPDGDPLTAVLVTGPASGTLTLDANGSLSYTPNAGFSGTDQFTYKANDGTVDSNVATATITVDDVNDAPTAVNDAYSTDEDTQLNVAAPGVLANDTDPEGNPLTAVLVTGPAHGTLTLNADGSFTYTPAANYSGLDSLTYKANDGTSDSNTAKVTITVNAVNDAPTAVDDAYSTDEDVALNVAAPGVLANDTDPEGNPLTAVLVTGPAHGTLTLNADGSFTYTPAANYNGPDQFTYKANDGTADSNVATVSITVSGVAEAPVAVDDAYSTDEDTALNVAAPGVLANDTDPEGDPLTAVLVTGPASGTLALDADGSFTYTPAAGFSGQATFTYKANDGALDSNVATVTITVAAVNDAPTAVNDTYTTDEDVVLNVAAPGVLGNDTDPESNALTAVLVTGPANGTLTLNADGSFTYTPAANFNGSDSFTYKANDGTTDSNTATVTITVNPVVDAPVATNDAYSTNEDTPLSKSAAEGVLANDSNPEGGTLTAVLVSTTTNGVLSLSADGSFTYTPNADFFGTDSFTYKGNNGSGDSNVATVTITVNAVNDPPTAVADAYTTDEDVALVVAAPGVLGNDTDPENSALTSVLVTGPAHGTLTLNANGSFTYTPAANYFGADAFSYKPNDGSGDGNTVSVSLTVNPVNDAPVAGADAYDALGNVQAGIPTSGVLGNDTDVDNPATDLSIVAGTISSTNGGTVVLSADGSFTYVSAAGFNGSDSFSYTVKDTEGATATGTVAMTVTGTYWFVDASAAPGGDGRQNSRFQSLTPLNGAGGSGDLDDPGDIILVHSGTYSSPIALEGTQQLIGQGIPAALTATVNGQTVTLLATGSAPTIGSTSGDGITLGSGNTLRGFVAGSAPGAAIAGSAVGTLTIADVSINNGTGRALDLTTSGSLSAVFGSISSTGGTGNGINLVGQTGTLTSGSTSITNPSETGIHVQGSGGFSFGSTTVSKGATGGTGVHLQGNTGTTTFSSLAVTTSGGTGLLASSAGTLSVAGGTISATGGPAIDATSTTLNGAGFSTTSSTGSPNRGISLTGVSGTWSLGSGSIGTAAAEDFLVSGGNAGISYAGSITNTASRSVSISGRTGGTVTLSGNISDTGTGILVQNGTGGAVEFTGASKVLSTGANPAVTLATNTGATISFADSLRITTTTGGGFSATGGGTVTVAGTRNSITSAGGVALNVANTTIGAGGLNFRSISANGGASGIVLNNTGSVGRLQVTGSGTAGSGGTIQNTTGHGISLTSTSNPSFDRISLQSNGGSGIFGTGVVGFTLTNSTIATSGTGGGANASNIDFFADTAPGTENNLSGVVTITGNTLSAPAFHNVDIQNWSGTISDLNLSSNVLTNSSTQGGGIRVIAFGGAGNVAKITKATIANNQITGSMQSPGLQVQCGNASAGGPLGECGTVGSGTNVVSITSNQVRGTSAAARIGTEGLLALLNGRGQANFDVSSNDVRHTTGRAMAVSSFGQGTMTSTVSNNTIVANNTFASAGLEIGADSTANMASNGTYTATVTGNNVSQSDGVGIWAISGASSHTLRVKLQNNTVAAPLGGVRPGIRVDSGRTNGNATVCLNISGNTSAGSGGSQGIGLRKDGTNPAVDVFGINGMAATSSPGVEAYVAGLNPAGGGVLLISATSGFTNCSLP